jgi:hypothetical protein
MEPSTLYPVLVEVFGVSITSYGVSKALAALAAAILLVREFRRLGWNPDLAVTLVTATTLLGFLGGDPTVMRTLRTREERPGSARQRVRPRNQGGQPRHAAGA